MIKVKYYIDPKGSHLIFDVEAETIKQLFRNIAEIQEVFEGDKTCGRCGNDHIQLRVRNPKEFEFFELVCMTCNSTLELGETKDKKSLFPRRKDKQDKILSHRGWLPPYTGGAKEPDEYEMARGGR
jgi:late competence protein required for DNA uptake (superfamily II DNA/RNA helicase)